jgi:hypothetical protein
MKPGLFSASAALTVAGLLFSSMSFAAELIKVPTGKHVLLDGKCEEREWEEAKEVDIGQGAKLLLRQSGEFAYFCVKLAKEARFGLDLFFAIEGKPVLNLHASAKLGERSLGEAGWPAWQWWNNSKWSANVGRGVDFEKRDFLPDSAKELQVHLSRMSRKPVQMMLQIQSDQTVSFPADAKPERPGNWLTITFI